MQLCSVPISLSSKLELVQSAALLTALLIAPILILMTEKWATEQSCIHIEITSCKNTIFNCSDLLDLRNLQKKIKKTFNVRINCSSDLKNLANSQPSASNFKSFSPSLEQYFLTVGQNNFENKIQFLLTIHFCCENNM